MQLLYIHDNYVDSEKANVVQVIQMCQALANRGAAVRLAIAAPRDHTRTPDSIAASILGERPAFQILTYRKVLLFGRMEMLGIWLGVRTLLRGVTADVCYVRDPLSLRLCLNADVPTVFEAHASRLHNKSPLLNALWERSLVSSANKSRLIKFVAISHALGACWREKGVPAGKITVLHNGFSGRLFEPETTQEDARRKLDLPLAKKIIVYAGRLSPDRGIDRIIHLAKSTPRVEYIVIGGPETRKIELAKRASAMNAKNISWIGHVSHAAVPTYLFAADILLMLWTWEVPHVRMFSPLKMFEYMAAGRLVVGEAFPTITEVLDDGKNAFLSRPDSFEDLAMNLGEALSQPYPSAMASEARRVAFAEYSWDARAGKILQGVESLA